MRSGLRLMRQSPGFTLIAVLTLGLGIGANTAIFSVVNALLLRPLPLRDPGRLVFLARSDPRNPGGTIPFSVAAYEVMRDSSGGFSGVTAYATDDLTLTGAGDPARLSVGRVAPNFFDVLGSQPIAGRTFQPAEGEAGADPVVLIGQGLWEHRFGSDLGILGKSITLSGTPYTVIGIMPRSFAFPVENLDAWITRVIHYSRLTPEQVRNGAGFLLGVARLNPGVGLDRANAEAAILQDRYRRAHPDNPDADARTRLYATPLRETIVGNLRPSLFLLGGAVGVVLLIACANVAGLLLARAAGRAREMAVRAALGATRARIVRQLLGESLLLAAAGAVCGVVLAQWGVELIVKQNAFDLPGFQPIRIDLPVLAFCLAISLVTGVVFGLVPAFQASRPDLNGVLRDSGRGAIGSRRHRARSLMVAGQMALSVVLLIGAALLLESFGRLRAENPGFDPHRTLTMSLSLPPARYPDDVRRAQFVRGLVDRLEALPGVRSASASLGIPMALAVMAPYLAEGQPRVPITQRPLGDWKAVTPDYFQTFGVPVLRGRAFTWADDPSAPPRVVVSQSLARRWFGDADPIGKHITYARREAVAEIVGVAGDVKTRALDSDSVAVFYTAYPQFAWPNFTIALRTESDPRALTNAARATILATDRDLPVINVETMEDRVNHTLAERRQITALLAGFSAVALLLAVVGLYGVMAYSVAQRTAEIGIRQAVGANRLDILKLVVAQGVRLTLAGIAMGAIGAVAATRLIGRFLFHTSATDPFTFAGISLLFLVVALSASLIPAWRATRIDPLTALR